MLCKSYHEERGIPFEQLWHWSPVRILVGIWSVADKYELRHVIRKLYLRQQQSLIGDNVDFKFIIGTPPPYKWYSDKLMSQLILENDTYGDIIILDVIENMNDGKAYYFWKWVGDHFSSLQYDYVVKTDDDVFIHFQNLALNLRPLSRNYLYYGYNSNNEFIVGILVVLSIDQVHMIASFPFHRDEWSGPEDIMLGSWLRNRLNEKLNLIGEFCLIFNDPRILTTYLPFLWQPWASPQSVAIHWIKSTHAWNAIMDLYFPDN